MKLIIICKDDKNNIDNSNNTLTITCGICKGEDTNTAIKMLIEDYEGEIDEIVYPNCDILNKVLKI